MSNNKKNTKKTNKNSEATSNELKNALNDAVNVDTNAVNNTANEQVSETTTAPNKPKKLKVKPKRKQTLQANAVRINPSHEEGLTTAQAEERFVDGLSNRSTVKAGKSILGIITSNTFTFFNLLCVLVFIAYASVKAQLSNFMFILPFAVNLIFAIVQ